MISSIFTNQDIEKIGNAIVYLLSKLGNLHKRHLLDLLFILEESSIKKNIRPLFGLEFELWQIGPIPKDLYIDLSEGALLLKDYIKPCGEGRFTAVRRFSNEVFNEQDIEVLDAVAEFAKTQTAQQLAELNRCENSLWKLSALEYGAYDQLQSGAISTEALVGFSLLFDQNEELLERYCQANDHLLAVRKLKAKEK